MIKRYLISLIALIAVPEILQAQMLVVSAEGDTVNARWTVSMLPDGCRLLYEFGAIKINQQGSSRFLTFAETSGNDRSDFFRTHSFQVNGTGSTLAFSRFASYDDSSYVKTQPVDGSVETIVNIDQLVHEHLANRKERVENKYFNSMSRIAYIVDVRDANTGAILRSVDTLEWYRKSNGALRYRTAPNTLSSHTGIVLSGKEFAGKSVYLAVRVQQSLPNGSSLVAREFEEVSGNSSTPMVFAASAQEVSAGR